MSTKLLQKCREANNHYGWGFFCVACFFLSFFVLMPSTTKSLLMMSHYPFRFFLSFVARKLFEFNLTILRPFSLQTGANSNCLNFSFHGFDFLPLFYQAIIKSRKGKWVNFNSLCLFLWPFLRLAEMESKDKLKRQWPAYLEFMTNKNFYRLSLLIRLLIYKC